MRPIENWTKAVEAIISIIENPNAEKGYQDLKKYYLLNKMTEEVSAVDFLIEQKFNVNNTNINKK